MPFVTEYNTSLILRSIVGDDPEDIDLWKPYKWDIHFLNKSHKVNLRNFKIFHENSSDIMDGFYTPIKHIDSKEFVHEGGRPSYHKHESCDRLTSTFTNFRIPKKIIDKGEEKISEFRTWFKTNQQKFIDKPDLYEFRLKTDFDIDEKMEKIEHGNSGFTYKENLSLEDVEKRIDSLLINAYKYYIRSKSRMKILDKYQKSTHLAFKPELIESKATEKSDRKLKAILREYHLLFIRPTIFYLREHFRISSSSNIEISEKIFEHLNFKRCKVCYGENFDQNSENLSLKRKILIEKFGDYEFPIEPTIFCPKAIFDSNVTVAFIYCRIFRRVDKDFNEDANGKYKFFLIEYLDHNNNFRYKQTKVYEEEISKIILFRKYITKIEKNNDTRETTFTTYGYQL